MKNTLNLTLPQAMKILSALAADLSKHCSAAFSFEPSIAIQDSKIYYNKAFYATKTIIGTKELCDIKRNVKHPIHPVVNDTAFITVMIKLCNIYFQCYQKNIIFRQTNLSQEEQHRLLLEIACMGSREYYESNYTINANEILAEKYGIELTHKALCEFFTDMNIPYYQELIMDIINQKAQTQPYFIYPVQSFDEIIPAFEKAYKESFDKPRTFPSLDKESLL